MKDTDSIPDSADSSDFVNSIAIMASGGFLCLIGWPYLGLPVLGCGIVWSTILMIKQRKK